MSEKIFFGDLLKQFRRHKRLNQTQLAERIEVTRETVSLWERGQYKPESEGILYTIVDVLCLTTQEQQQLFEAYTVTALAPSFHNPPLKRNLYFTGRSSQLNTLHKLLMAGKQVALTQAISGLGGIGKTQLALEYAYRYQKSYHDIFWVNADTEESLIASYVLLAGLLHLPEYEEADQSKVKEAVQRWLRKHTGWLLIFDNMEDLHFLQQFVPVDRQGAVLLTTRRQVTETIAQALELKLLPENEAILFLLKRTKVLPVDRSLEDASDHDIEAARTITRLLGNLPLALDQAGAYILETPCSFAEYLALFQAYQDQLLQRRIGENIPTDHPESVTATFRLNFQQIQQRSNSAAELLRLCAYLAPDAIPEEILTAGASHLGPVLTPVVADSLLFKQAIEALRAYSLVQRDPEQKTLSVHRLVQAVLQDTMGEMERRTWGERAMLAINAAFPHVEHDTWPKCERLLAHALLTAHYIKMGQFMSEEAGRLLYETASYLQDRARYPEAEPLYQRALRIREQQLGPDHPDVALSLNGLANLYFEQGKYVEAEPLYQRALRIRKQQLGPDHPDVALSLNGLANLYFEQDMYVEAESLHLRALHIREQQLGPDHLDVTISLNNLANLYSEQGKYAEAESLYQRALQIREQQLGPDHPDIALSLNNLAALYFDQGKYAEAELLFQRALHILEQQLGLDHPDVADSLNNLAFLYFEQGKYAEAEPLYQQALHIREQQLGPEHPDVADSLNGLAILYSEQDMYVEAEPLFQRALHIREQLGLDHHKVAGSLTNLAFLYSEQDKYAEAEPLFQQALHILEQQLGPDHPLVAHPLNGLATLYSEQGKYAEVEPLYLRALYIREQQLGPDHPKVADSLNNLVNLYSKQGKYAEVEPLFQRALHILEQQLGLDHPDVALSLNNLATLYSEQGKYAEAEPLYQRALHILEQQLGLDHPETAEIIHNFARSWEMQGNSEEARVWYARALAIREQALGAQHPKTTETRKHLIILLHAMGRDEDAAQLEATQLESGKGE